MLRACSPSVPRFATRLLPDRLRLPLLVALAAFCLSAAPAVAEDIVAVEEEWTLLVDIPHGDRSSPQLSFVISPLPHTNSWFATFLINQRTVPENAGGGLELQLWNGPQRLTHATLPDVASLQTEGERIQWTQSMSLANNGTLTFQVSQGHSTTWGTFGQGSSLQVATATNLTNLNDYTPNTSAAQAGIDFGANRVRRLILNKVRIRTRQHQTVEHAEERVVWQNE